MNRSFPRLTALAAACLFFFVGCTQSEPSASAPRQIKIGLTLYTSDDTFISNVREKILSAAKEREDLDNVRINVNVADGRGNQSIQNDQVDKFLSQGYDVICVNEVDRTAASVIIDKARAAQIPVVFFNREPVGEDMQRWDRIYYVGSDASQAGIIQGDLIVNLYDADPASVDRNGDGKVQYVMLEGEPGHQDAAIRTEYCIKTITTSGIAVEKLANESANWQRAQGTERMGQWIAEFGDAIEVVISNNDDMALGAIDAYAAAEITDLPVIVGVDATPTAMEAIRNGTLAGTVFNDYLGQGQAIFDLAYALAVGQDPHEAVPTLSGKYVFTPHYMVTAANVDDFPSS